MDETKRPLNYKVKKGASKFDVYYNSKLDKYVRVNAFDVVEYLDPKSYIESLNNIDYYNRLIDNYLKNIK